MIHLCSTIKVPLYFEKIDVVVSDNFKNDIVSLDISFTGDIGEYEALVFFPKSGRIVLMVKGNIDAGVLAHECVHIANEIFKRCNIMLDIDNDEPYAYLLGWLVDGITKIIETKKCKYDKRKN